MIVVLVEHAQGNLKKKSLEATQYAAQIAQQLGGTVTAVAMGSISEQELAGLGQYGATNVLHVADSRLDNLDAKAYTKVIAAAVAQTNATVVVGIHDTTGKAVMPRVAMRLKAGLVAGAVAYPNTSNGFVVKKSVFSGKAFAYVQVSSAIKCISLMANTFPVVKGSGTASVASLAVNFDANDFAIKVTHVEKASGQVPLSEAELVVSGGRGMKGPENWHILESLAQELGAATACSRPVADSHWRPHGEHVGQTGGTIRPNLYVAIGISGAIQHLAGVNSSKTIVVINKDPEAPFFKAADYGVLGDAMEVLPRLTAAVKKFKASQN